MGALASKLRPSEASQKLFLNTFDQALESVGSKFSAVTDTATQAMDAVKNHPWLARTAAIVFPPLKGAILMAEAANGIKELLQKSSLKDAGSAFGQAKKEGQETLMDQINGANKIASAPQRRNIEREVM